MARDENIARWQFLPAPPATYKQETTIGTLSLALAAIRHVVKERGIRKVFVCGDMLEHAFPEDFQAYINEPRLRPSFSNNIILYLLRRIKAAAGSAEVYYVLGNNDTDRSDYVFPSRSFLRNLAQGLFAGSDGVLAREFEAVGYSCRPLSDRVQVIGLNGGLLTRSKPRPVLANRQLGFLRRDLEECRRTGRRAIILMHEPFGIDPYYSFQSKTAEPVLDQPLQDAYVRLLSEYAGEVATIYTGHFHMEYFGTVAGKIPIIGTLALNSFYGNNPGFKVLTIDDGDGRLVDCQTYIKNISQPQSRYRVLYDFNETYRRKGRSLAGLIRTFPANPADAVVKSYRTLFNGRSPDPEWITSRAGWPYYFASIKCLDPASYSAFLEKEFPWDEFHPYGSRPLVPQE